MMRSNKIHIKQSSPDARFGSKADMTPANLDVRFTSKSGILTDICRSPIGICRSI
jgi:hypothetical protein